MDIKTFRFGTLLEYAIPALSNRFYEHYIYLHFTIDKK